ncbi:MAG: protoporphyrinogen/coproporphyrinogen oxidase [Bacteroidales bacterium]
MKVGILGAGITGLSIGKLLNKKHTVQILEEKGIHGGIARTKNVDGVTYHTIGGHCFNSKYKDVLDFVFNEVLPLDQWNKIQRKSSIHFKNHEIDYPIEFSIKQIFEFDQELAIRMTSDFLNANDDHSYENLDDWFRKKFGNSLSEEYFIPYNTKIWNRKPSDMNPEWVEDKLPIPDKKSFFEGLIKTAQDNMAHAVFYYPKSNNQNTFIDALAEGLDIVYNTSIHSIRKIDNKWIVNDQHVYDILISTIPLDILPSLIEGTPKEVTDAASKLRFNKVSNVIWKSESTTKTWSYHPEPNTLFHRYIHLGSFFTPSKGYTITEVIGDHSKEEMIENGIKDPFLIQPLDHNTSNHAYVVFDENYPKSTALIKEYLTKIGLHSIGRFGEWQYYNMDVCIKSSIELAKTL